MNKSVTSHLPTPSSPLNRGGLEPEVSGDEISSDPAECLEFANIGYHRKHFATGARMFVSAFTGDPRLADDVRTPYLSNAAALAALAGSGRGEDGARLSDADKAKWRQQIRQWVRAVLMRVEKALGSLQVTREDALDRRSRRNRISPACATTSQYLSSRQARTPSAYTG